MANWLGSTVLLGPSTIAEIERKRHGYARRSLYKIQEYRKTSLRHRYRAKEKDKTDKFPEHPPVLAVPFRMLCWGYVIEIETDIP